MRHFLKYSLYVLVLVFAMQGTSFCMAMGAGGFNTQSQQTNTIPSTGNQTNTIPSTGSQSNTIPSTGSGGSGSGISIPLQNPLGNITIQQFFLKIIDIILIFAMPIIVLFIILAGFKYVTAQGNTEQIKSATTALTWALVGGVLILGAKAILTIIEGTVQALR